MSVITKRLALQPREVWWGGCVDDGYQMPFRRGFRRDLADQQGNQVQPLLVSNRGRWIWSDEPFAFEIGDTELVVEGDGLQLGAAGPGLRSGALDAARKHFPPAGTMPDRLLFSRPQYNTWIELQYGQSERGVLDYAQALLDEGYPPGVLMIDDSWQLDYGRWRFARERFDDPRRMIDTLHRWGFKVVLWVCPQVSPVGQTYLSARDEGLLILDASGKPAVREWWNGHSAILDMTNPRSAAWLRAQLDALTRGFGVDGFKFDAGDFGHYRADDLACRPGHPGIQSEAWARFAETWPLSELRASWKMGNRPVAQRLRDKAHSWGTDGLGSCLPNILAQSVLGYPYSCPDMIGGGEYTHFNAHSERLDEEIFVRHAQLAALLPMQQFSAAPWRLLSRPAAALCLEAAQLHAAHGDLICALAETAAVSGEPIVRPLGWVWNDDAALGVHDEFLLGDDLLVAPVVTPGARARKVTLPPGTWEDGDNRRFTGPREIEVEAGLDTLPRFRRVGPLV